MSDFGTDENEWEDAGGLDIGGHIGPWPAFVDLFAATTLILLVFFTVIAARYIGEVGDVVKVTQLYQQLQNLQRQGGQFTAQEQGSDVLLILEERVTFKTSQADLLPGARETLRQVTDLLRQPGFVRLIREIEILGHADRRGDNFANWQLSAARAVSVAQFLVDSLHENPCIIVAAGRGAYFPRDTADAIDSIPEVARLPLYARDRRVEILLHPSVANEKSQHRGGCLTQ